MDLNIPQRIKNYFHPSFWRKSDSNDKKRGSLNLKTFAEDIEIKFTENSDSEHTLKESERKRKCINVNRCDMTIEILISDDSTRSKVMENVYNNLHVITKDKTETDEIKNVYGKQNLDNISRSEGDVTGKHVCSICGAKFAVKHRLKTHERVAHWLSQFVCIFCKKEFPLKKHLSSHILSHKGENGYKCGICCKIRPSYAMLQRHMKIHTEKKITCESCGACFRTRWELKSHELQHNKTGHFDCSACGSVFTSPTKFREHSKQCGKPGFICDFCGKVFSSEGNLRNHRKLHSEGCLFSCQYCTMSFLTSAARKRHMITHEQEKSKPFSCINCGKKYSSTTSLAIHNMKHQVDDRSFTCLYCKVRFNSEEAAIQHSQSHILDRPYSCNQCLCRYKNKRELRRHQREKGHDDDVKSDCDQDWDVHEPEVCIKEIDEAIPLTDDGKEIQIVSNISS
ncbi:UNVERIFIED_CONTAM: hypothetical protein PYX00_007009 [Menopon gallinae]|uniref:C2H2-type domain-containing protein n=1 Tax=Menopon gallinae TaxID=328185 RepID=A0AAW2HI23_9NEOP